VRAYFKIGLIAVSAIILSMATILYFNNIINDAQFEQAQNVFELASLTFMPYMISAAIAALTAFGVTSFLLLARFRNSIPVLEARLREMAAGDLASRVSVIKTSPNLYTITNELNNTIIILGQQVAALKIINRQQWEVLQSIREAAAANNSGRVIQHVEEMETNWQRMVQLEKKLVT